MRPQMSMLYSVCMEVTVTQPGHPFIRVFANVVFLVATLAVLAGCVAREDPAVAYGNQLGAVEYVVKKGDNLVLIAADVTRQQENWRRIADFNRIDNPATLRVGQKIWIPKDLIPLENETREVAGHPDAVVNSVNLPNRIKPEN